MKSASLSSKKGFSLIETVIAIGVLAVLLSGFMIVFAPAAAGIRKSINSQDAARLISTLEQELVTLRGPTQTTAYPTGFDKAFFFIKDSSGPDLNNAMLLYKYRASLIDNPRNDGTPVPQVVIRNQIPGKDYVIQTMMRRVGDPELGNDLGAIEGPIYLVKCKQLLLNTSGQMVNGQAGQIKNSFDDPSSIATPDLFTHAVIAFTADFMAVGSKSMAYFSGSAFQTLLGSDNKPDFSRNLAIRR